MIEFMNRTLAKTVIAGCITALLIVVFYFFFDRPLSETAYIFKDTYWHELAKIVSHAANGLFIKTILAASFILGACDALRNGLNRRSRCVLYVCVSVAAAMIIGDVLKELFGRARPPLFFDKGIYGFFPLAGDYLHSSFPSGHTLRIFSAMTAFSLAVPRLRIPAMSLAILVGISRVIALKHYPSDVLFGAFIGMTVAIWAWRILYPYGSR